MVPVRRNFDNAVGMYDMVQNKFYASDSEDAFIAGPAKTNMCVPSDYGHYVAADTVNYGSSNANTLNACPTGYGLSDSGAGAQTDCYAMCTVNEVPHATAFSGANYYGGTSTCVPADSESCDSGYSYIATNGNVLAHCELTSAATITINWGDTDGSLFESTECTYGGALITPINAPIKRGHTFLGWRLITSE